MKIYTKIYTLAVAAVVLALASPVQAQDWYVSGGLGVSITPDSDTTLSGTDPITGRYKADGDAKTNNPVNFSLAAGKRIANNIRTELELSHRKTKIKGASLDRLTRSGVNIPVSNLPISGSGNIKTTALLVNGYYDFNADKALGALSPYVSAGLGLARHNGTFAASTSVAGTTISATAKGSDTVFAYQLGAGASLPMSGNTDLVAGYRYLGTADANVRGAKFGYEAHEINVGLRYGF